MYMRGLLCQSIVDTVGSDAVHCDLLVGCQEGVEGRERRGHLRLKEGLVELEALELADELPTLRAVLDLNDGDVVLVGEAGAQVVGKLLRRDVHAERRGLGHGAEAAENGAGCGLSDRRRQGEHYEDAYLHAMYMT